MIGTHIYTILNDSTELTEALVGDIWPVVVPLPEDGDQVFPALAYSVAAVDEVKVKTGDENRFIDSINVEFEIYSMDYLELSRISYILRKHLHKRLYQCAEFRISSMSWQGYSESWDEGMKSYSASISYIFKTHWIHI